MKQCKATICCILVSDQEFSLKFVRPVAITIIPLFAKRKKGCLLDSRGHMHSL